MVQGDTKLEPSAVENLCLLQSPGIYDVFVKKKGNLFNYYFQSVLNEIDALVSAQLARQCWYEFLPQLDEVLAPVHFNGD